MIVAIDGPAGSGKSTVARLVADKAGFLYLDSGALYRTLTLIVCLNALNVSLDEYLQKEKQKIINGKIALLKKEEIIKILQSEDYPSIIDKAQMEIRFVKQKDKSDDSPALTQNMLLSGKNVSDLIRFSEITKNIRYIANHSLSRDIVNKHLRFFAEKNDVVIDGRDIGTEVFPQADLKFYLDASVEERAGRRYREYRDKGLHPELSQEDIKKDIASRDESDFKREIAPLKIAENAIVVDTTALTKEEVFNLLLNSIKEKGIKKIEKIEIREKVGDGT